MTDNAISWGNRAKNAIAHSALTNSKRPSCFTENYPTHLVRGDGCYVWSAEGRRYVDFICGLGTNLLGYAKPSVMEAAKLQLSRGSVLSLSTTLEVQFGEMVKSYFPFVERLRALKSGAEGCSAAVRIARAATDRPYVFSEGFHGWHDQFTGLTPPARGVANWAPTTHPLSDLGHITERDGWTAVAAIIVEPFVTDASDGRIQWLRELKETCTKHGIVMIFDETITALRFPGLSVAHHTGIYPDLIVFGKALANGLPISVVGGRKDLMEADYFVSSTFAGDMLAMGAAMEVLPYASQNISIIWSEAESFQKKFNDVGKGLVWIEGYPTRGVLRARDELTKALFMQEACGAGLLFGPSFFWCQPHAAESALVLELCDKVISKIKNGQAELRGRMPAQPFAQQVREKTA